MEPENNATNQLYIYHLSSGIKDTDRQIDIVVCGYTVDQVEAFCRPILLRFMNDWSVSCARIKKVGFASSDLSLPRLLHVGVVRAEDRRGYWSSYAYIGSFRCQLYLVSRPMEVSGEFASFIVCAPSGNEARQRHPDGFMHVLDGKWFYPPYEAKIPPPAWVEPSQTDSLVVTCLGVAASELNPGQVLSAAITD